MQDGKKQKAKEDPKAIVIDRLITLARLIRKTGPPDEAIAAAEYEQKLEGDRQKLLAA